MDWTDWYVIPHNEAQRKATISVDRWIPTKLSLLHLPNLSYTTEYIQHQTSTMALIHKDKEVEELNISQKTIWNDPHPDPSRVC